MMRLVFLIAITACLPACQSHKPETPAQAVEAILGLYEARDFDKLIRTRYAEISKAENEQQIEALVDRFRTRFADEEALAEAVSVYGSLRSRSPQLSEDGTVATYPLEGGFVRLSRMPDGRWGFHL